MASTAAYVTLLTNTDYLPGTLVLEHSLRSVNSQYPLVVLITPDLPEEAKAVLRRRMIPTREVDLLFPAETTHELSNADARFKDTWTKLRAFELTEYKRVVLLDSDMLVLNSMDELIDDLELPHDWIAASHACACNPRKFKHYPTDWVPENCAHTSVVHPSGITSPPQITENSPRPYNLLNSGLVVLTPSSELADSISHYLSTSPLVPTFSFPDQDLLAAYFRGKWKPLPYIYNALKTLRAIHKPLWRDEEVKCVHYILSDKPWKARVDADGAGDEYEEVNRWWWGQFGRLEEEMRNDDPEGLRLVLDMLT